ncbi:DinB family protein [Metabacillus sp. KIGAM252]|uniref:DinB family protein n=1 Tax=Metabacillus flavus TaxID=2823519 RepID=A0ABS5LGS5_9BACI|nr:DinB family protein [Metabacillus flavus]MBS2969945.1 DinB family protein [Metabacillus flavus]
MYITVADFIFEWKKEAGLTQKLMDRLTDDSLKQQVYPEGRTLGSIVWHFTVNIPDYLAEFGLEIDRIGTEESVPSSAQEIAAAFKDVSAEAARVIQGQWKDETLKQVQEAFGRQESNASILMGLIKHIVHHRGQATVLMRQAGLKPAWIYGPAKEDWIEMGIQPRL